jgi:hypothetical protein
MRVRFCGECGAAVTDEDEGCPCMSHVSYEDIFCENCGNRHEDCDCDKYCLTCGCDLQTDEEDDGICTACMEGANHD